MVLTPQQLEAMMPDGNLLLSEEPEMESSLHYIQLLLLVSCLEWLWRDRTDFFVALTSLFTSADNSFATKTLEDQTFF